MMELEDIKRIVYNNYKVYIKRKKIQGTVGYCTINKQGSVIIVLDKKLNGKVYDLILKHELGHIYYRHFDNLSDNVRDIRDLYKKLKNKNLPLSSAHKILNICQDIVIHDTILSKQEVQYIEGTLNFKPCTSESFNAPPLLSFNEYYEYVINKLIEKCNDIKSDIDNTQNDQFGVSDDLPDSFDNSISLPLEGDVHNGEKTQETDEDVECEGGELQKPEDDCIKSDKNGKTAGEGLDLNSLTYNRDKILEQLKKILIDFLVIGESIDTDIDSFRKSQRLNLNDGIFRKSLRLKTKKKKLRDPITIVVDSSGSMGYIIQQIISTIDECRDKIDKNSVLILWSESLDYESYMKNVKEGFLYSSGGTKLAPGLRYALSKYTRNKILFISDYEDFDAKSLVRMIVHNRKRITGVNIGNTNANKNTYDYLLG